MGLIMLTVSLTVEAVGQQRDVVSGDSTCLNCGIAIEPLVVLDDKGEALLGRPRWVSLTETGDFVIGDRSDRNIKVYASDGSRTRTVGRAGQGPAEFSSLSSNGILNGSIMGYDFAAGRLTLFAVDGSEAMTVRFGVPPPFTVRVADDSTVLLVGHPSRPGNLLKLAGTDGAVLSEFFSLSERWVGNAALQHMAVFADAFGGLVFAGMFGGDRLRVFDYGGARLAEAPIDSERPLRPLDELAKQNREQVRRDDGTWVHHGQRMLMSVVATADSTVTLQIAEYDSVVGTDILDGGLISVLRYAEQTLEPVGQIEAGWGVVGRDDAGRALVMRYHPASRDRYEIGRIIVGTGSNP